MIGFLLFNRYPNQTVAQCSCLRNQITDICFILNRDQPERFVDLTWERNVSNNFLFTSLNSIGLDRFLYQMLLGYELLIRLRKEASIAEYKSILSNPASATMHMAELWVRNVRVQKINNASSALNNYQLVSNVWQDQTAALIKFAEAIKWPYSTECQPHIASSWNLLTLGYMKDHSMADWLFGLVRPGRMYRYMLMTCLLYTTPVTKSFKSGPTYSCGIVLEKYSYWPRPSVMATVMGGLKDSLNVCGWTGPVPSPENHPPEWVFVEGKRTAIPIPCTRNASDYIWPNGQQLSASEVAAEVLNTAHWMTPHYPTRSDPGLPVSFKKITLRFLGTAPLVSGISYKRYQASIEFEVGSKPCTMTLHYNPVLVTTPGCQGTHQCTLTKARAMTKNIVNACDIITMSLPVGGLCIIDATKDNEELLARAWCAQKGVNAVLWDEAHTCFACAANVAMSSNGLAFRILIRTGAKSKGD
jgi:hypothetical protein